MKDSRLERTGIPNGATENWQGRNASRNEGRGSPVVFRTFEQRRCPLFSVTDYQIVERVVGDCFPACGKTSFLI